MYRKIRAKGPIEGRRGKNFWPRPYGEIRSERRESKKEGRWAGGHAAIAPKKELLCRHEGE